MKFESAYGKRVRSGTINNEPSKTKQSEFDKADINSIVKRHMNSGTLADLTKLEGVYGEITELDLMAAHKKIFAAQDAFMQVPSMIRKQFDNSPGKFIDFATNPINKDQMILWGLAKKDVVAPVKAPVPVAPVETPNE